MPILKKETKKKQAAEEIPMFHKGDLIKMDVDGDSVEAKILSVDNDEKTASVETDDGDKYDCTFDEMTPAGKPAKKVEKEKEEPVKKSKKKSSDENDSFADIFNKTKASAGGVGLPEGKWEANAIEAGLSDSDKGLSGFIKYEITEDEHEGRQGVQFYQLVDPEGEEQQGFAYFKGALETLGLVDSDTEISSRSDMEEILEKVDDIEVVINVREKGGYANIYLDSVV